MSFSAIEQIEQQWSLLTQKGNDFFHEGNHQSATACYQQALFISESMVRSANDAEEKNIQIASPFFVSCLNMANNFWVMGDLKKAGDYFFFNVWHLKMLSKRKSNSNGMYLQATDNWQKAVLSLLDFYEKTNQKLITDFWKEETYEQITNTRKWLIKRQIELN
jgi:hypothetical protein